jgi:L-asparagine transporter-like permease
MMLAAHGDAPQSLVRLSKSRVPARAILIGSLFGYVAVVASVVSPSRLFAFLVNASGALMLIIYLLIALAQIRLRRHWESADPQRLTLRMWGFPWLSYAVVAAICGVLLAMLARHRGKVMTHRQLLREVWGGAHTESPQYLRIYMRALRQKIEAEPARPQLLLTEVGVGYRLLDEVPAAG